MSPAPKLDTSMTISPLKLSNSVTLEWHLTQIGNRDIDKALDAMQHIDTLLTSDQVTYQPSLTVLTLPFYSKKIKPVWR